MLSGAFEAYPYPISDADPLEHKFALLSKGKNVNFRRSQTYLRSVSITFKAFIIVIYILQFLKQSSGSRRCHVQWKEPAKNLQK